MSVDFLFGLFLFAVGVTVAAQVCVSLSSLSVFDSLLLLFTVLLAVVFAGVTRMVMGLAVRIGVFGDAAWAVDGVVGDVVAGVLVVGDCVVVLTIGGDLVVGAGVFGGAVASVFDGAGVVVALAAGVTAVAVGVVLGVVLAGVLGFVAIGVAGETPPVPAAVVSVAVVAAARLKNPVSVLCFLKNFATNFAHIAGASLSLVNFTFRVTDTGQ